MTPPEVIKIQTCWRRYRTKVMYLRYVALAKGLRHFLTMNPSPYIFIQRNRLN